MTLLQQASVNSRNSRSERAPSAIAPFKIRGRLFTALVLEIAGPTDAEFYAALDAKLAQVSHFFTYVPLVLDLKMAAGVQIDFKALLRELRARRLALVGVQNGTAEQQEAALAVGLITLRNGRNLSLDDEKRADAANDSGGASHGGTLVITSPVRSGQRILADKGDLIVIGSVSSGAELIARGNIHVYGAMRGRALAGANGDTNARIFCQNLEAELIAIAGIYRTTDDIENSLRKQRAQVFLRDEALYIEPLK